MKERHQYQVITEWTGNLQSGTSSYTAYSRNHTITVDGKPTFPGSSDPAFRGDATRYNPEELLVASLSSCHMLWYLHLCASNGVVVLSYKDTAMGFMEEKSDGSGAFTSVTLRPTIHLVDAAMLTTAQELHQQANRLCFIANSVNFPVRHEPMILVG